MLLRPRKNTFKNFQKKRTAKTINVNSGMWGTTKDKVYRYKTKKLSYGQFGLQNRNPNFFLFNKYLFKIKLFLKKAVRRGNITNRHLWVKVFPHIPVTKKVIGSRMGKGKGKPNSWAAKIPSESIFIELRNVRPGRAYFFLNQIYHKLPGTYYTIVSRYGNYYPLQVYKKVYNRYDSFY